MKHIRALFQAFALLLFAALGSTSAWTGAASWSQATYPIERHQQLFQTPDLAFAA